MLDNQRWDPSDKKSKERMGARTYLGKIYENRISWGDASEGKSNFLCIHNQTLAERDSGVSGWAISEQVLEEGWWWEMRVVRVEKEGKLHGGAQLGVTRHASHPSPTSMRLPRYGTWTIRDEHPRSRQHSFNLQPAANSTEFGFGTLNIHDEIRLVRDRGTLAVSLNGKWQGVAFRDLPKKLYACIGVNGQCAGIRVVAQGPLPYYWEEGANW
eukprot:CAMPEP_0184324132 /NCGR_PEP_ID=MMETSP1049-20130417/133693_1 /TAXON_ID=77928 /ORGANISM="Proteomonas sulcata, Strain CCMP704" /LENGTH=212 /DNA_ID=CAMNT_0026645829 /DNA_START=18 /DNA_END=653 /DNA_ORIENTATION=+